MTNVVVLDYGSGNLRSAERAVARTGVTVTVTSDLSVAAEADGLQVVSAAMLGHKADLALMALGEDLWRLRQLQTDVTTAGIEVVDSYVSLTEISEYAQGVPDEMKEARLHPQLPPDGKPAFCFYPMSKRRAEGANWYSMPFDARKELMAGHARVGRTYSGRVLQLITGSTGLDDWEWGVTLLADDPVALKEIVYEMRFDEASARYGEFGPFYVGVRTDPDDLVRFLCPEAAGEVAAEAEGR